MKVSVVIPAYNEERYIGSCLESLMNQDIPPEEIIVVNNNSTDKTAEIVNQFPVRLLTEDTKNVIIARNKGFDSAVNDILARTDADTQLPPNWIAKIKENFKNNTIDALSGPISYYDTPVKTPFFSKIFYSVAENIFHYPVLIGPNMAITKKIWNQVKSIVCTDPTQVHEDIDIGIHIAEIGGKIMIDPDLVVQSSGRRIMHQPQSFFIEYTQRLMKMNTLHKKT